MPSRETQLADVAVARCEEKIQLVINYAAAAAEYSDAVAEFERMMVCASYEVFAELRRSTDEARLKCEAARQELDNHVPMHGC